MKKVVSIMLMVMSLVAICSVAFADTYVRPNVRGGGSFVQGHYRSDRDNNRWYKWSHRGNVNPHTGQRGNRW